MKLEICANSLQSALNAQMAGADRVELCSELSVGGITPSLGLLKAVREKITIPVHVLIRPRSGDFNYSDEEFEQMKIDIQLCKDLGFAGIVSGVLSENNSIDIKRTQELIDISKPLSFTFHRAFDCVPKPEQALEKLIQLGVNRILTSGQKDKAIDGLELLKQLKNQAKEQLIILPGSGIRPKNAEVFREAGFKEIHASASVSVKIKSPFFDSIEQTVSDPKIISEIVSIIRNEA
jgi:copper homeostasis protein